MSQPAAKRVPRRGRSDAKRGPRGSKIETKAVIAGKTCRCEKYLKTERKFRISDGSEGPVAPRMDVFSDLERSRHSQEPLYPEDSVDLWGRRVQSVR